MKSLQDIIRSRQGGEFIGRDEQLLRFRRNLDLSVEDNERLYIFNVYGQAGVGKTWLMRRLREVCDGKEVRSGYIDEAESDVLEVMEGFSIRLKDQGVKLKKFDERLRVYRQKRQELEADPKAPKGTLDFILRSVVKAGVNAADRTLVGGVILDVVDKDALTTEAAEWSSYIARKFTNKDELSLVREPIETLTPLFVSDLRQAANESRLALFFDTYEHTGAFLDGWLRALLEGRYGTLPADIVITIAGQYELDKNLWSPYAGVTLRMPLEPFTEDETRAYLRHKGVVNEMAVELILKLSGGLPLLVGTLASEGSHDVGEIVDPHEMAVARFLKWIENPDDRLIAVKAALPRFFNKDIVAVLVDESKAEGTFDWLKGRPFVAERREGRVYHQIVRDQMLRHMRRDSPHDWSELHRRFAELYEKLRDGLETMGDVKPEDATWQAYALEASYHRLCQLPSVYLATALQGFLTIPASENAFARRWAEVLAQVGRDTGSSEAVHWGELLTVGLVAREEGRQIDAAAMFTALIDEKGLNVTARAAAHHRRGGLLLQTGNEGQALRDFVEAAELHPEVYLYWFDLAGAYLHSKNYEESLASYTRASEVDPSAYHAVALSGWALQMLGQLDDAINRYSQALKLVMDAASEAFILEIRARAYFNADRYDETLEDLGRIEQLGFGSGQTASLRGETFLFMERAADAIEAFSLAIKLNPNFARNYAGCAEALRRLGRPIEALTELDRALAMEPDNTQGLLLRAVVRHELGQDVEALEDFAGALKIKPDDTHILFYRGIAFHEMKRYENAVEDFTRVIDVRPDYQSARLMRGDAYLQIEQYDAAAAEFSHILDKSPGDVTALNGRGRAYRNLGRYDEALSDLNRAVAASPDSAMPLIDRGLTHQQAGHWDEALADFDRVLDIRPEDVQTIAMRAETLRFAGQGGEALVELDRALTMAPDDPKIIASRAESYRSLGRLEEARTEYIRALKLDKSTNLAQTIAAWSFAYRARGNHEDALAWLDFIIESDPNNAQFLEVRGDTFLMAGRFDEAYIDFAKALEVSKDDARLLAKRGEAHRRSGRYAEALGDLDHSLAINPDYATALTSRGLTLQMLKRYDEALSDLNQAVKLKDGEATLLAARGTLRQQMGDLEKALEDLNRAIALNPGDGQTFAVRGETYMWLGRYEDSLEDLNRSVELGWTGGRFEPLREFVGVIVRLNESIRLDPNDGPTLYNRARLFIDLKRPDEALNDIIRLCDLFPEDVTFRVVCGSLLRELDRHDEAVAELTRALEFSPTNPMIISMRGKAFLQMERYEEAVDDLSRVIELAPDNILVFVNRGAALGELGRLAEALTDLNKAIDYSPRNEIAYYNRGLLYLRMARNEEALIDFQRALELRPDFEEALQAIQNI